VTRDKFQSSDEVGMGVLDMLDQLKIKENYAMFHLKILI